MLSLVTATASSNPVMLVIAALVGLAVLLLLIIKFKTQAMIAILVGAIVIGLLAGMPLSLIIDSVTVIP